MSVPMKLPCTFVWDIAPLSIMMPDTRLAEIRFPAPGIPMTLLSSKTWTPA